MDMDNIYIYRERDIYIVRERDRCYNQSISIYIVQFNFQG